MTERDRPDERPDLDEELRRLFADERLTLPVAENVEHAVLAGAHRRRRRRTAAAAAGGVLAVAALVFVGATLTGVGGHLTGKVTAAAASPRLSTTLTTSEPPPSIVDDADVIGPYGAEGLKLGMPAAAALKTDITGTPLGKASGAGKCMGYTVIPAMAVDPPESTDPYSARTILPTTVAVPPTTESPTPASRAAALRSGVDGELVKERVLTVFVSPRHGIVQLGGAAGLHTPEGIGPGTSEKRVYTVYATAAQGVDKRSVDVPVPGNDAASYVFYIGADGTVESLWLRSGKTLDCDN
ncbi:MAG TPA: hypothetical protein VGL80_10195 [Pseudonocardiaceae bacterium]|jgi:hypothetical protein